MDDMERKEEHIDFTTLVKQIDSTIDPDLVKQLKQVEIMNIFLKCDIFGNEELIPVGSCIDGSKVTVPSDSGDIDVLIVSNRVLLKESLFDYDNENPAFLHIRVKDEHEKYFKTVKNPIEGVYLPISVLKELRERLFFLSKVWLNTEIQEGMSNDGKFLNVTRTSAVGKEQMKLYPAEQDAFEFKNNRETLTFALKRIEKFAKCALDGIKHLAKNAEEMDEEDRLSAFATHNQPDSNDHYDTSLLEMLRKFLDMSEGKESDDSSINNKTNTNEDLYTDDTADEKCKAMPCKTLDTEGTENASDKIMTELLRGSAYKSKLSQDCTTAETKRDNSVSDSKLNHDPEYKNAIDSDSLENFVKESSKTEACTQKGTAKDETSFSKIKSTDFVPAFKFEGWPRVADEWLTRPRKWPSKVTLKLVLESGCQVVAKRPLVVYSEPIAEERDPYFRLSFALSEIILAHSMKEQQLLCWRVLKAYQKAFLETRPKCLTSYRWKNVVFWVSENLDESFWEDENILLAVLKCLDLMQNCLQNRNLPFYFVRKMNLFNGCDYALFDSLIRQVEAIRRKPLVFLERFLAEPPNSETHFLDIGEIEGMLSQEAKAQNKDRLSEEIVNGFINHFPAFCKGDDQGEANKQMFHKTATHLLKTARSEIGKRTSHVFKDAQNSKSLQEEIIDGFEKITNSMKTGDEEELFKTFDNVFKSVAHDRELNYENSADSESASKQSLANIFSTAVAGKQKIDGSGHSNKAVNEASQKIGEVKDREDKKEKKLEMDIDLD
ncbi:uncharacterized protein LOC123537287 [Mercenaria mercenaria]|uniref:uncharacterized protein LOC123537287 n=1 Tax=Mercenaria mercenaria TaxID=6596 RepID=UPI00234E6E42|nr:uncharacterized protein LOC123537287 [Mercenaria mercenaria]